MAFMKRPRLAAVKALPRRRLELTFRDGNIYVVDLSDDIQRLPALAWLKNARAFARAALVEGEGWTVNWPDLDIQISADTLWLDAQAQVQNATGDRPVPRYIALACKGWEAKQAKQAKQ